MNRAVDQLAISIFRKPLNECWEDDLRKLSLQYPWFAPAQLLYAKKLQTGNPSLYEDQVQKTTLYFPNRVWLHHLLTGNDQAEILSRALPAEELKPAEMGKAQVSVILPGESSSPEPTIAEADAEPANEEMVTIADQPVEEMASVDSPDTTVQPEVLVSEPVNEPGAIIDHDTEEKSTGSETEMADEPALRMPAFKIEPINPAIAPLSFQPYHTVDYFASQGIKFKEQEKPKDRFGQQLLSFTEWLKTLKKMPASEIAATVSDPGAEKKVEQLAEHSLAERHVVTEAMAEVWIKQGNYAKAEDIYRKLSLLDPPKTAYFAAKIEELKKTS
ncbi:MAG: hypothetical protein JNN00_14580 [Chitinophagaceae bacterium]|nr:hypothetical protein [Chitinophagaceae bacterium]